MWALAPETSGIGCVGLGRVADALCRRPELRGLSPASLARALGTTEDEAARGIARLAVAMVGAPVDAGRLGSLDVVLGGSGRSAPPSSAFTTDEASGGMATPSRSYVMNPGTTYPDARTLPTVPVQLVTLQLPAIGPAPPMVARVELPARIEDLDTLAGLTGPPYKDLEHGFGYDKWSDFVGAYGVLGQAKAASLFALFRAFGALPEDAQFQDDASQPWYGWPSGSDHLTREIFVWAYGPNALYQQMQVQKYDERAQRWRVFNKWGQDLMFARARGSDAWTAGWDFGDWFVQHAQEFGQAMQLAVSAVIAVMSFGAGTPIVAATAAAMAVQRAFVAAMTGIATGDFGAAMAGFVSLGASLAGVNAAAGGELLKNLPPEFQQLAQQPAMKQVGALVASAQSSDLGKLITQAVAIGKTLEPVTAATIANAKTMVPDNLRPWLERGFAAGASFNVSTRANVPWYGLGAYDFGASLGAVAGAQAAVKATKVRGGGGGPALDTLPLEQQRATLIQVRDAFAAKGRPEAANVQAQIDAIDAKIAAAKLGMAMAPPAAPSVVLASRVAAMPRPQPVNVPPSKGSAALPAVGLGLAALLFFL